MVAGFGEGEEGFAAGVGVGVGEAGGEGIKGGEGAGLELAQAEGGPVPDWGFGVAGEVDQDVDDAITEVVGGVDVVDATGEGLGQGEADVGVGVVGGDVVEEGGGRGGVPGVSERVDGGMHHLRVVGGGEDGDQSGDDVVDVFWVTVDEVAEAVGFGDELVGGRIG